MTSSPESLAALRGRIATVDRSIAAGIAERLELARKIAGAKSSTQEPTRDFEIEARVISRWRQALGEVGIPAGRSEALARWLIEESVRVQEEAVPSRAAPRTGPGEIAVVGGAGAMGRWLVRFFEDQGREVSVVDPRAGTGSPRSFPDIETAAERASVLAFATPIRSTAPLLERALTAPGNPLVFDILSVKAPILSTLRRGAANGRRVTSVHPMFGPVARTLSGRNLLIVSCGVPEADREVRNLFSGSALSVTEIPLDRHDLLIAESLGLAHAVNLLFLSALAADPASPHDLAQAASTTFHRQSALARSVAEEGAELYLDIQSANPNSREVYRELREALERLVDIVGRGDLPAFSHLLRGGAAKLESGQEPMRT